MKRYIKTMFLAVAMTCSMPAMAQNQTVQGTVVDETGEPVIGATVKVEGTKNMAVTDFDGNYKIDVPCPRAERLPFPISATRRLPPRAAACNSKKTTRSSRKWWLWVTAHRRRPT